MDPLTAIRQWYEAGEEHMKEELVFLVQNFHVRSSLQDIPEKAKMKVFREYMHDDGLTRADIVQRTIFMKGLINFGLSGRDTEEGWERARRKNEQLAERLRDSGKGDPDFYQKFMRDFVIRKDNWIAWSNVWRGMERDLISDDHLGYWYYVETAIKDKAL